MCIRDRFSTDLSLKIISPLSGLISPAINCSVVLLPHPDTPNNDTSSPSFISDVYKRQVLYTSGLIAGEGLVGVLLAIFAVIKIEESSLADIINLSDFVNLGQIGSVIFFALLILTLFKFTIWYKDKNKAS